MGKKVMKGQKIKLNIKLNIKLKKWEFGSCSAVPKYKKPLHSNKPIDIYWIKQLISEILAQFIEANLSP